MDELSQANEKLVELSSVIWDQDGNIVMEVGTLNDKLMVRISHDHLDWYVDLDDMVWITEEGMRKYNKYVNKEKDAATRKSFDKNLNKRKTKRSPKSSRYFRSS